MSQQRIRDFIGNRLDFLSVLITGVTASSLNNLLDEIRGDLNSVLVSKLCNVSLLAMALNRVKVTDYLSRAENADLSRLITTHFYIQNHVNFTALNLLGHLLLAGGVGERSLFVSEYRRKLGGLSIWHANISRSELSEKQKEILKEKVRKMPSGEVLPIARIIVLKLARIKVNANVAAVETAPIHTAVPEFVTDASQQFGLQTIPKTETDAIPPTNIAESNVKEESEEKVVRKRRLAQAAEAFRIDAENRKKARFDAEANKVKEDALRAEKGKAVKIEADRVATEKAESEFDKDPNVDPEQTDVKSAAMDEFADVVAGKKPRKRKIADAVIKGAANTRSMTKKLK